MSRVDSPALRGTLLGRALRLWNPVMRRLLRSPLHWPLSRWFAVIQWRGRKTGRTYSTPVSYVVDDGVALITSGDRWWRNLIGGADVTLWLAGQRREGRAEPVLGAEDSVALHQRMFARRRIFARLAGVSGPDPEDQLRRSIGAGRTLVRVRLRSEDVRPGD